jgi:hypothetical protein
MYIYIYIYIYRGIIICVSFVVWVLNERLNYKSMEIKWYKYMKVDP